MRGKPPIIAITMGDPCGIGPEVIAKTLAKYSDVNESYVLLLFGSFKVWEDTLDRLGLSLDCTPIDDKNILNEDVLGGNVYFYDLPCSSRYVPGELSAESGAAAMRYLEQAVDFALDGEIEAIVTAPISKEHINKAGYQYAGHTDYFSQRASRREPTMCFYCPAYTVSLVCDHVPLREVHLNATEDRIYESIIRTNGFLKALDIASPKIGVMGLNPHCGEEGILGDEELSEIVPAISKAAGRKLNIIGPLTPEIAFLKAINKELSC